MKKIYVLDTNVLLHDAHALFNFADNELVIPLTVLEELDKFKKNQDETGRNARQVSRTLDGLRAKGRLTDGVALESGGVLRVVACDRDALELLPLALKADVPDNRILAVAMWMVETRKELPVIFVTKDVNLRIKADTAGLTAQDYESDKVAVDDLYSGIVRLSVPAGDIDRFQGQGFLEMKEALSPNQCVILEDDGNPNHVGVGRYQAATNRVVPLKNLTKDGVWGIKPRNVEQQFALDLLLDDNLQLVTINGKAGTGKTLLAIAVGLLKVADEKLFSRLLISRPIFPMGKDLGFLPGGVEEK
ncbi:MAG: PhoH family protein, partial [Deltaproteobacteria bacterium]|nr:PhoH family protein [Deltaproteobacteria bacterium]